MEIVLVIVILGLSVGLIAFGLGLRMGKGWGMTEIDQLRRQFRELQLAKAADEKLIDKLQQTLEELQWKLRRGD